MAELLEKRVPLTSAPGIDAQWELISGEADFMHNALRGKRENIAAGLRQVRAAAGSDPILFTCATGKSCWRK